MTRREHHKLIVKWEKHCKIKKRCIDKACSKNPLADRKILLETIDWLSHEKGLKKAYPRLKETRINKNTLNKTIEKIIKEFNYENF